MIARVPGDELPGDEATDTGLSSGGSSIDPVDRVRGLAAMDALRERLDVVSVERRALEVRLARNAVERHMLEHGHRLVFGCCANRR